jgi:hypothetical protein
MLARNSKLDPPPTNLEVNTAPIPPADYITKVATVRLQFTQDHYVVFRCFTVRLKEVWLLLSPKDATLSAKVSDAVLNFGLYYADVPSLAFQAQRAAQACVAQRGTIAISNGWLSDGHKQFVYGDRVLSSGPHTSGKSLTGTELIIACPGFDTGKSSNLAGPGSLPPDVAGARRARGTPEGWKQGVAKKALKSSTMMAAITAAFAAALVGPMDLDSFILLIAGDTSGGKTTTLLAAGSVIGLGKKMQLPNWKTTDAGLELLIQLEYSDMMLPIDELSHLGTEAKVFEKLDAMAYFFDAGANKKKHDRAAAALSRRPSRPSGTRSIVLTSYEKTLGEIEAAVESSFRGGVGVRLVEIPMCLDAGAVGIFDNLPDNAGRGKQQTAYANKLAKNVRQACRKNNGRIFILWIKKLLADPSSAKAHVRARMEKFISKAGFDRSNRLEYRHAEHFAFLYGAGSYAIECGFLPWSRKQLWTTITKCYNASRASLISRPDPAEAVLADFLRHLHDETQVVSWPKQNDPVNAGSNIDGWMRVDGTDNVYRIKATAVRRWFPTSSVRTALEQALISKKYLIVKKKGEYSTQQRVPKSDTRLLVYDLRIPTGTS